MVPSGVGAGGGAVLRGPSHTAAITKAQIEAELSRTPAPEEAARPAEPTFDPWDRDEPVQLPLRDPRETADPMTLPPFLDSAGQMLYDDLFILQLPSSLPITPKDQQQQPAGATTSAGAGAGAGTTIAAVPETYEKQHEFETPPFKGTLSGVDGYMGRLRYHRSGRVTLRLTNGVEFDLHSSSTPRFLEELFLVSAKSQTCYRLGPVARHTTVLPNTVNIGLTTPAEAADAACADAAVMPASSFASSQPKPHTQSPSSASSPEPMQVAPDHGAAVVEAQDDVALMEVLPTASKPSQEIKPPR